jgi:pSer/pThr/pTyr-binding forkhead associated (FHA) protein
MVSRLEERYVGMKKMAAKIILICFAFILPLSGMSFAAVFTGPEQVKPGEMFVVTIKTEPDKDTKILLNSESGRVQFMGAVQGTPDIQMRSETLVEIEPKLDNPQTYELKFLALGQSGSTKFSLADAGGQKNLNVAFVKEQTSRNYSWIILAAGLALLVLGIKVWRYQKSSPNMMSTKSLFLNYEELEKARKMYFDETGQSSAATTEAAKDSQPDKEAKESSKDSQPTRTREKIEIVEDSPVVTQPTDSGGQTAQRPGLRPVSPKAGKKVPASKMKAEVKIALTDNEGKTFSATGAVIKVGRRRDNNIILSGSEISRSHVEFFNDNGVLKIRALTQSNITQLKGIDVKGAVAVRSGAKLNLGGTDFIVKVAELV